MTDNAGLHFKEVYVTYSSTIHSLQGPTFTVNPGHVIALLGSNGAGKSTVLKAISGLLGFEGALITGGSIEYDGEIISGLSPCQIAHRGIVHVLQERHEFKNMSVAENLRIGAAHRQGAGLRQDIEKAYAYFPALRPRSKTLAKNCSLGELRMMAIARALIAHPNMILLDEPSLGLAPLLVNELYGIIGRIRGESRFSLIIAEQNANMALNVADYGYVLEDGTIVMEDHAQELRQNQEVREFCLAACSAGRLKYSQSSETDSAL